MLPSGSKNTENVGNKSHHYYLREKPPLASQATACESPSVKKTGCSCKGSCSSRICGCVKKSNKCGTPSCKCDSKICQNQVEALESQMREVSSLMFNTEAKKSEKESELNDTDIISIDMLNDDCLRHIFLFLPIVDRVRIEIVCKRWRDLSQDSWYMIKTLDLSPSTWGVTYICLALLLKILLKCGRFLTRLKLNFEIANLHDLGQDKLIIVVGELCPNLMSIEVRYGVRQFIRTQLANYYRNITKFNLTWSTVDDNELKCFFERNQNLEYLAITGTDILGKCLLRLPEQTMRTIILEHCDFLQDTHLSMALKKLENLKHLAIINCLGIFKHTLEVVGQHCKSLRTLELIVRDFSSTQTADMLYLIHLVNLQVLKITWNSKISDDFLTDLVQHCQQLTDVDITGCNKVSDVGLTAIATLVRLEKLIVSNVYQITDDGLKNVCGLKELECQRCLFNDRGMTTLIQSSPELQLLDLSGCTNIKDPTLEVAKDVCRRRTNNVMLKMIVGGTSILIKKKIRLPPLLHIVIKR